MTATESTEEQTARRPMSYAGAADTGFARPDRANATANGFRVDIIEHLRGFLPDPGTILHNGVLCNIIY